MAGVGSSDKEVVIDNPCWGSPEQCSLRHLLEQSTTRTNDETNEQDFLRRRALERFVLYDDGRDFVAINKPPDLRMDGPYPATVHKLLLFLFPTPCLLRQAQGRQYSGSDKTNDSDDNSDNKEQQQVELSSSLLLNAIQSEKTLHRHNDLVDHKLAVRPCHQLDYATSGLLWVARTPAAAQVATRAFEDRRVLKTYTALVHGHVSTSSSRIPTNSATNTQQQPWPVLSRQRVEDWLIQTEDSYRKQRRKRRPETFQGFLPPHSLFVSWKNQHRQQEQHTNNAVLTKRQRKDNDSNNQLYQLSESDWTLVWKTLQNLDVSIREEVLQLDWKAVKTKLPAIRQCFQNAADMYNQVLRDKHRAAAAAADTNTNITSSSSATVVPTVFRIAEELDQDHFYIAAPLTQVADEFAMRLPGSLRELVQQSGTNLAVQDDDDNNNANANNKRLNFKTSLTKCTVQQRGYQPKQQQPSLRTENDNNDDVPVTMVRLEPRTGRRHQLRVHMALVGHPIVGDDTYRHHDARAATSGTMIEEAPIQDSTDAAAAPVNNNRRAVQQRMCLHSHKLSVQLPYQMNKLDLHAPDPFRIDPETQKVVVDEL